MTIGQRILRKLEKVEREMKVQAVRGMDKGWPVLFWDRNCVERALLRSLLGMRRKPFCKADTMGGW